jgi:hypothetical protein
MMVVRVVEDQAVADADEAPSEGMDEMVFGQDVVGWSDGDGVLVDEQDLIADPGVVEIMGRDDDGVPGGDLVADDVEDETAGGDVEAGDGFVEHQEVGLLRKALRNQCALALATGKLVELPGSEMLDAETLK